MEVVIDHRHIPKPRTYEDFVNRPNVDPRHARRLQITNDTVIRGRPIYTGSVIEVDLSTIEGQETDMALRNSLKAIRVKNDVLLVDVPDPGPTPSPITAPPPLPKVDMTALASELIRQLQAQPSTMKSR